MKILFISAIVFLSSVFSALQNNINFTPKQLFSEIKKITKSENPVLTLIDLKSGLVKDSLNERFYVIENAEPVKFVYVARVNTCRAGGCSNPNKNKITDSYEFFDYFILFDKTAQILSVSVYNYEATHGHEITSPRWLKQFVGYTGKNDLDVGKDIDAISGATISVYSLSDNIAVATQRLNKYLVAE